MNTGLKTASENITQSEAVEKKSLPEKDEEMTNKKSVMVVDDSAAIRQLVMFILKTLGYEVICSKNGKEALNSLRAFTVDLVIADINMPEMDGITFVKELRGSPAHVDLPVVMLTTESQEAKKKQCAEAGINGWIRKPFTAERLIHEVRRFVI